MLAGLLLTHTLLLCIAASRYSPTPDEGPHLAAGLSHWLFGNFSLYRVNPPFVRMVATLPVLAATPAVDWSQFDDRAEMRAEFTVGRAFVAVNGKRTLCLLFLARCACVPFSMLAAYICFRWANELYGMAAAWIAVLLWCSCPLVLGFGALITPDVGAAAIGVLACYVFWRWLCRPCWHLAALSGIALGTAELTKFTWLVLFVVWPLVWAVLQLRGDLTHADHRGAASLPLPRRAATAQIATMLALGLLVVNLGYAFEAACRPLQSFRFLSHPLTHSSAQHDGGPDMRENRFSGTWFGRLPVPVPAEYLLGIDAQKRDFELPIPTFFRGVWRANAPWYAYLYGLGIKLPLGTLLLFVSAVGIRLFGRRLGCAILDELTLLGPVIAIIAAACFVTGQNSQARYMLPILPPMFIWTSKVALLANFSRWLSCVVAVILAWSACAGLSSWPYSISYFNDFCCDDPFSGASRLTGSNVEWRQDLLVLRRWLETHPTIRPLYLGDSPGYDPDAIGVNCPSISDMFRSSTPPPGWYAVGASELWGKRNEHTAFRKFTPVEVIGSSIYLYHVIGNEMEVAKP